jgi:hypothetical protein
MSDFPYRSALIVGAGAGISASLARLLSTLGVKVGLDARNIDKLQPLLTEARAPTPTAPSPTVGNMAYTAHSNARAHCWRAGLEPNRRTLDQLVSPDFSPQIPN